MAELLPIKTGQDDFHNMVREKSTRAFKKLSPGVTSSICRSDPEKQQATGVTFGAL
jgi:hypothetical protein